MTPRFHQSRRTRNASGPLRRPESALEADRPPAPDALELARDRAAAAPLRRQLALALARSGQIEEARKVLRDLLTDAPPDGETMGLVGRINKDLAVRSSTAEEARAHLQTALAFYLDGYRRDRGAYCGINAASLHALLEEHDAARALASELLEGGPTEDDFWNAAIRGEASLLLGRLDDAREYYSSLAKLGGDDRANDRRSAWTQARRLCVFLHGEAGLLDDCFGELTEEPEQLSEQLRALRRMLEEFPADPAPSGNGSDTSALRLLAQELLQLQEEQRHSLSRELHDNIAQLLTATTNRISLARSNSTSRKLRRELAEARQAVEQALQAVSDLSRNLRSPVPDCMGLSNAIEKHAAAFRDRVKVDLYLQLDAPSASSLDGECSTNLFRIVQEALNNIEKHARATEARISLIERDHHLWLEVADNGCSFTPERAATAQRDGHLGLVNMRERAKMLGAKIKVKAGRGKGTLVSLTMPLAADGR